MCSFGLCQTRFKFLSQFRKVRNAFECFVTQVQTHWPKTRLAYEDKRDLYCICLVYKIETTGSNIYSNKNILYCSLPRPYHVLLTSVIF